MAIVYIVPGMMYDVLCMVFAACEKVMDAYFGPDGIEYTVGRIPMDSCDFGVEQYSFAEVPGDYDLSYFDTDVEKDAEQRVRAQRYPV